MIDFLWYLLESTICMGLFYGLYRLLFQQTTLFNLNRFYLLASTLAALSIPAIEFNVAGEMISYEQYLAPVRISVDQTFATNPGNNAWIWVIGGIYSIGVLWRLYRLWAETIRIRKIISQGKKIQAPNHTLVLTTENIPAFSFFHWLIIRESEWNGSDAQQQVIDHELVHIRQYHSLDNLVLQLIHIFCWPNPVLSLIRKAIKENHEFAVDQAVIHANHNRESYIDTLIHEVIHHNPSLLINYFNHAKIKRRIMMIHQKRSGRKALVNYLTVLPLAGLMTLAFSCSQTELEQGPVQVMKDPQTYPQFQDGQESLIKYLTENITYPLAAKDAGIEGTVIVGFIVDEKGNVQDVRIERGVHETIDESAIAVVSSMPKWKAGEHEGKAVSTAMVLPIKYKLSN